jgi:hypothetical protein
MPAAGRDASRRVAAGVEVEARHEAGVRLGDVIPDAIPKDRAANGEAVHLHLAAGLPQYRDDRGGGGRRLTHMQVLGQRVINGIGWCLAHQDSLRRL